MQDVSSPFMTPKEVAEYMRVSVGTVHRLLRDGGLPGVRVGHSWRIRRKDVEVLTLTGDSACLP